MVKYLAFWNLKFQNEKIYLKKKLEAETVSEDTMAENFLD